MSQKGQSLHSKITAITSHSIIEADIENMDKNISVKANVDILSQSTKSDSFKSNGETTNVANENSTSLSMPLVSVSCINERTLENSLTIVAENHDLESEVQKGSANVQDINTILNSKDARVVYISPDVFVFDHSGLQSDAPESMPIILDPCASGMTSISASNTTLNSNYLVVVENIDGSQMMSTTMHRNLVLSSGNDIPISSITPPTHISFSATESDEEGNKVTDVTDYTQSTITMVLDSTSPQLNSKGIIVEPSSFITYSDNSTGTVDQLTFHAVHPLSDKTDSSAHSYESSEGSFIDISSLSVVTSEISSSTTVHCTPSTQAVLFNAQETPTAIIPNEHTSDEHCFHQSLLQPVHEIAPPAESLATLRDHFSNDNEDNELEHVKKERLKQELRFLEQCHLEHHLKQVKRKQFEKIKLEDQTEDCPNRTALDQNDDWPSDAETEQSDKIEIDDETPIFSTVTATLNSTILAHIAGCQQFLLKQAQENSSYGFNIEFTSDKDCTFNGTLKSLVILHNIIKNVITLKTRTVIEFRTDDSEHRCIDKAVMCDLLKPYISLRGRQPKCSLKAAEMGFVNNTDLYWQIDSTGDIPDMECESSTCTEEITPKHKRKRRKGQSSRGLRNKVKQNKVKYTSEASDVLNSDSNCDNNMESGQNDIESCEIVGVCKNEVVEENPAEQDTNQDIVAADEVDLTDPLQQRLLQEQLKYKKIVNQKRRLMTSIIDNPNEAVSSDLAALSNISEGYETHSNNAACTDISEVSQENTSATEAQIIGKPKRGRPRKAYGQLCMREKVHARNPLTESAATKQQRNYEEQVSFKFFCHQCSFKTKRQSHFVSHMSCHRNGTEKKYTCKHCDFITISIPMLKRHELKHSKSLFKCGICAAYTTDRQELLRRHFRMKHSIEQKELLKGKLRCDQCRFSCLTSEELEKHKTVHDRLNQVSDDDVLNCPNCKKAFRSRMHLQRHIRDVHGPEVRPHLCDKCGKAFKRTDALQQHKLVHVSRTARNFPFKCTSCDKGFRSPAHLKEHMSMHSSERPFLCQYCGAAFKTQPVQKKHILTLHIRPRAHVCSVCCRQFNTMHALQRHENTHAKPESVTEAAVLVIERENAEAEKEAAVREANSSLINADNQSESLSVSESAPAAEDGQMSNCLVHEIINSSASAVEEPLETSGPTLQQAYIQGTQDGTLYYFTGELPTL